ncbi:hypothetical protein D3C87_1838720 [compost metagenome]
MNRLVHHLDELVEHRLELGVLLGVAGVVAEHRPEVVAVAVEEPIDERMGAVADRYEGDRDDGSRKDVACRVAARAH